MNSAVLSTQTVWSNIRRDPTDPVGAVLQRGREKLCAGLALFQSVICLDLRTRVLEDSLWLLPKGGSHPTSSEEFRLVICWQDLQTCLYSPGHPANTIHTRPVHFLGSDKTLLSGPGFKKRIKQRSLTPGPSPLSLGIQNGKQRDAWSKGSRPESSGASGQHLGAKVDIQGLGWSGTERPGTWNSRMRGRGWPASHSLRIPH
ncbi:uncharacterized protein [Alexandromys fortis]|uniref:uncharacterized protein n=1 Tax=Alexandromys fortis TaxID=100897 RepID=UPI002153233E|nr:uncharacterized protein LOC126511877 [Microtus fortis]